MENAVDNLNVIAEFSVGMAGFAGIVAVVVGSNRGWNSVSKFRAGNLIVLSIMAGFSALISLGLAQYIAGETLWQTSCGVQACACVIFVAANRSKSIEAFGHSIFSLENPVNASLWSAYVANLVLQILGAFGVFDEFAFAIFYGGLVFHLAIAALNFYRLVFPPENDPDDV